MKPRQSLVLIRLLLACLLPLFAWTGAAAGAGPASEDAILEVARSMMEAYKKQDLAVMQATLADDFIGTYDDEVWDKKAILAAVKTGDDKIEAISNDDVKIRQYPGAAIMTGRVTAKETYKGKDTSGSHRFTIVFVQKNGKWLVASEHWSRMPPQGQEH